MKVNLRRAFLSDLQTTFKWVNHEAVRRFSLNTQAVSFDSHNEWFSEKIKSEETAFYILENSDKAALGSIRFDLHENTGKINYLVDPQYHGMGLAMILVKKGIAALKEEVPEVRSVYGWVFQSNVASVKIFEKLEFRLVKEKDSMLKFEYQISNHEN